MIIKELFYEARMLIPLVIMYIGFNIKIKKSSLISIIKWLSILISGSIVLTNILVFSLGSYTNEFISANIFSWFTTNYSYMNLASKSFFYMANPISVILLLITPIIFYAVIKNKINSIYLYIQLFAMFILGTKTTSYGFIIISIISLFIYLYFVIIK